VLRVKLNDNTVLNSHSSLNVQLDVSDLNIDYGFKSITTTETYNGLPASGYITIKYANPNNKVITKPLIVAEGYDTGIITNPESKYGDNSIKDFVKVIQNSNSSNFKSLFDVTGGYDFIYIDYKNGVDDIKRNALLLEEVIRQVNAMKVGAEKNVVMGISMGGLVARWGLRDMENKGQNHQTRLYISYDSPHQGANFPVSIQYLANNVYNLYNRSAAPSVGNVFNIKLLNELPSKFRLASYPASRQLSLNYIDHAGNLDNSIHQA
jgi:hypothetical protein